MLLHKPCDGRRMPSPESTFRCNAEIGDDPSRSCNTPSCTCLAVSMMYQPQVQARVCGQNQLTKRFEIGLIIPIARYRHVNPCNRSRRLFDDTAGYLCKKPCIFWFTKVLVSGISIAKVQAHVSTFGNCIHEPRNPGSDCLSQIAVDMAFHQPF